jgi:hypothetical protein
LEQTYCEASVKKQQGPREGDIVAGECHQADELTSFVMLREISARPEARARLVHRKYDSHYHSLKARQGKAGRYNC